MKVLSGLAIVFLLFGSPVSALAQSSEVIGLTAGSETGTYIKIARDIAKIANDSGTMKIKVSPGGSVRNIDRIRKERDYQFAIVQYDALVYKALVSPSVRKLTRVVFPLYLEEIHILARKDAGIDSLKDLAGKRVNIGREDTGPFITGSIIKALEELTWQDSYLLPQDALLALLENRIDAMIYTVGQPWGLALKMDASHATDIKLLSYESEELEPYFPKSKIPANTYSWQKEDVTLHATTAILVTYNYGPDSNNPRFTHYHKMIYELVGLVTKNLSTLRAQAHPKWREIDPLNLSKVNWPAHVQAEKAVKDSKLVVSRPVISKNDICKMFGTC
ncbi:MAG: TAXI family TRAP transporter solute-binding subunit [Hyphomicrobiales bacterium]